MTAAYALESALDLAGVAKSFDGTPVLTGVDLSVRPGEVLGLVGRNGVGKSTLASILAGSLDADAGTITINGSAWDPSRVGIIEQELEFDPDLTVSEAMYRHAADAHASAEERDAAARRVLVASGIALDPTDKMGDLGEADQRLVEVVRLLADPREVMIIDEVSTTFNAREVEDLRYAMRSAVAEGRCAIYITHRLQEALDLCSRIAVLRDGTVTRVLSTLTATEADLSEAMFDRVVHVVEHASRVQEEVALRVRDLDCGGRTVSFDVRAGEVLGFAGTRASGLRTLAAAFTGERPRPVRSMRLTDQSINIDSQRAATRLRIAIVSGRPDEVTETYFAQALMMLNKDATDEAFDAEYEDTIDMLLALRAAEERAAGMFRKRQSVGQRRRRQLREVAAAHARLLVLLEPTRALDLEGREHFNELLDDVTSRGVPVLLFTSDETELHRLSDRIAVMEDGAFRAQWPTADTTVDQLAAISRGEWPDTDLPPTPATVS